MHLCMFALLITQSVWNSYGSMHTVRRNDKFIERWLFLVRCLATSVEYYLQRNWDYIFRIWKCPPGPIFDQFLLSKNAHTSVVCSFFYKIIGSGSNGQKQCYVYLFHFSTASDWIDYWSSRTFLLKIWRHSCMLLITHITESILCVYASEVKRRKKAVVMINSYLCYFVLQHDLIVLNFWSGFSILSWFVKPVIFSDRRSEIVDILSKEYY